MTSLGVEWGAKYTLTGPDGTVVVFNDSTDPNFIGVLSPESSGLDSADVREDATDATEEDGGHHGDFFEGRRPVVLQGTIIASSATQRNERVGKLKRATRALRRDATLEWEPAGGAKVELKLRRQQPLRITKGFTKEFQAALVAADPFPKSVTVHSLSSEAIPTESSAEKFPGASSDDSSFGEVAWTNIANIKASDSVVASAVLASNKKTHYAVGTNFGFTFPANAAILGIKLNVKGKSIL